MERKIFNIDTSELDEMLVKDITYVYSTFTPDKENRLSKMKSMVSPWAAHYARFLDKGRADDIKNGVFVRPYDLLSEKISKDIEGFYTSIWKRYDSILRPYGERADKIRSQFKTEFSKSAQTTTKKILEKVNFCVISGVDANRTIDDVMKILDERKKILQKHMYSSYLQMMRSIVLWKYQDAGYGRYKVIDDGEVCEKCAAVGGKIFYISEMEASVNFPPIHINCCCEVMLLDKDGNDFLLLDNELKFVDKESPGLFEYMLWEIKKVFCGDFMSETHDVYTLLLSVLLGKIPIVDTSMDYRDLAYAIEYAHKSNFDTESTFNLALAFSAFIPEIGNEIKLSDDAVGIVKNADVGNVGKSIDDNITRLIPGKEGIVSGGSSSKLGKNMLKSMGLPQETKWKGYQAQHIIPAEMAEHPVIKKIGMDLDNENNGLFLRIPQNDISTLSRHKGYHSTYNEFVKIQLDKIDINQDIYNLQVEVYMLQQDLKKLQKNGIPLYPSQGGTTDLWQRSLERIKENG